MNNPSIGPRTYLVAEILSALIRANPNFLGEEYLVAAAIRLADLAQNKMQWPDPVNTTSGPLMGVRITHVEGVPDEVWGAFHTVWTWCVGKHMYDKRIFTRLEDVLLEMGRAEKEKNADRVDPK